MGWLAGAAGPVGLAGAWGFFFFLFVFELGRGKNILNTNILYRTYIYQNDQKKISYNMNYFSSSNKILKNLQNSNSVAVAIKPNKNHF